jgi:hypothetical protein
MYVYICVSMLLTVLYDTTICDLILLCVLILVYQPHLTLGMCRLDDVCIYLCQHATKCAICVLILLYVS